jgi:hypothetical protein
MLELVKFSSLSTPFKAIGVMLRSFSHMALLARGVSIKMLQWLDGARLPPKCLVFEYDKLENLTNSGPALKSFSNFQIGRIHTVLGAMLRSFLHTALPAGGFQ